MPSLSELQPNPPKIFFMNPSRLPKVFYPQSWNELTGEALQRKIKEEGFIAKADFDDYPALMDVEPFNQEIQELEELLIKPYFIASQKAKFFQNMHFLYQWVLVIGAFVTTLFATVAVTVNTSPLIIDPSNPSSIVINNPEAVVNRGIVKASSIATALVSFVTTIITAYLRNRQPQYEWYSWRRVTEELRRHYFMYLTHLAPYDKPDRVEVLERNVVQIKNSGGSVKIGAA